MFNNAAFGRNMGKWMGTGIGSIFGSGDYTIAGQQPNYNVLTSAKQTPKFVTNSNSNVVSHREYLGDVNGTTAFNITQYRLNPGDSQTFPWLSSMAANYQQYKFHGLIFEFRPLTTDFANSGVPGVVVMATNYNAIAPEYTSKQQMENSDFAVSCKPTLGLIHGVECAPEETSYAIKYIRAESDSAVGDNRLYDLGNFQFATQGNSSSVVLGELWVSYCVEFLKPILPTTIAGGAMDHIQRNNALTTNPFGATQTNAGVILQIGCTVSSSGNTLTFPDTVSGTFNVRVLHFGTATLTGSLLAITPSNCTLVPLLYVNKTGNNYQGPAISTTPAYVIDFCVIVPPDQITSSVTIGTGALPTNSNIDIFVTSITTLVA
jgi:hypothetical protein